MSTVVVYLERTVPPDTYPCTGCKSHGPYCGDFCPLLDAWNEQRRAGRDNPKGKAE